MRFVRSWDWVARRGTSWDVPGIIGLSAAPGGAGGENAICPLGAIGAIGAADLSSQTARFNIV